MMEYKFRGYDAVGNKGWVYGDLTHNQKVTRTGLEPRTMVGGYEVYPESVGLFSGLRDRLWNEIYEGDVVRWTRDWNLYHVFFRDGMFYASIEECYKGLHGGFPLWTLCRRELPCEIVGDVFKNKELWGNSNMKKGGVVMP